MTKFQCFVTKSKNNLVRVLTTCSILVVVAIAFLPLFIAVFLMGDMSENDGLLLVIGSIIVEIFWISCVISPFIECYIRGETK